jgi:aspartate-semialdehyde dehydrogenase
MPLGNEPLRVAIAGATSLRGRDLKEWIEQSGFPVHEVRLFDEDLAAGTLTELAGEPTVIQAVDESSFDGTQFVFFAGSPSFAVKHAPAAGKAGATVIDLTGGLAGTPGARPWVPSLDRVLAPPAANPASSRKSSAYLSLSTPAIVASSLSAAFGELGLARLAITFFQPVSERGQLGIDELEAQTVKLLSVQSMPQQVFDAQVAFNLLDRWGPASEERLSDFRAALASEVQDYLAERTLLPAMTLVQAPVFYGHAFTAYAEFSKPSAPDSIVTRLEAAGFKIAGAGEPGPSNVGVAGEDMPMIARPEPDASVERGYWFWGAADSLRLATVNAVRIAERLLAS